MKAIRNLKEGIWFWFLKRAHSKLRRNKKLLGYGQARSFGIIYDATSEKNYRQITLLVKDLQQDQRKVKTLGYVTQKKMPEHCFPKLTFEFCNAKSFSWNQQPVAQNVKDFISTNYDVLVDLTPSNFHHVKYLCAISQARMKTGRFADKYVDVYDLMLQVDDSSTIEETIGHVLYYLKMINNEQTVA